MKKLLCLLLTAVVLISAVVAGTVPAAAAADTLTVVCGGDVLAQVPVGSQFIYRVGLFGGDYSIEVGEGKVHFDSRFVKVVEYGPAGSRGNVDMNAYSFPQRIRNASLETNFLGDRNNIYYSFARIGGVGAFKDVSDHYFKVRFQATAAGTVEIKHTMSLMSTTVNGKTVRLFRDGRANEQLDPIPYTIPSAEAAEAFIGDTDGDGNLTILDATLIQRLTAGMDAAYKAENADVNGDKEINLRDALAILRYKAGMSTDTNVGEWIFPSEK